MFYVFLKLFAVYLRGFKDFEAKRDEFLKHMNSHNNHKNKGIHNYSIWVPSLVWQFWFWLTLTCLCFLRSAQILQTAPFNHRTFYFLCILITLPFVNKRILLSLNQTSPCYYWFFFTFKTPLAQSCFHSLLAFFIKCLFHYFYKWRLKWLHWRPCY